MSSDWWSRKLAGETPAPQHTYTPPVSAPLRFQPMQAPHQAPQQSYQGNTKLLDPTQPSDAKISMGDAMRLWQGGEARKDGDHSCPSCGSGLVFSRANGSGSTINGMAPAPRCYSCGWNGKYQQADQANWMVI